MRSHIKSFSKLKVFELISKCPLKELRSFPLPFHQHQNHTINEEFEFFEGGSEEAPGGKGPQFINFYLSYYW